MKKIDSAIRNLKQSTPSSKPVKASKSSPATPKAETPNTQTSPAEKSPLKKAAELDSDPENHPSSPAGSREVTGRQSKTASKLTSETPRFDELSESSDSQSESSVLGARQTTAADVGLAAEKKQGKDKPTDSQLSNQDKKWVDKTQDEINAEVNALVEKGGNDPESYDKIAEEMVGLPEDQKVRL